MTTTPQPPSNMPSSRYIYTDPPEALQLTVCRHCGALTLRAHPCCFSCGRERGRPSRAWLLAAAGTAVRALARRVRRAVGRSRGPMSSRD